MCFCMFEKGGYGCVVVTICLHVGLKKRYSPKWQFYIVGRTLLTLFLLRMLAHMFRQILGLIPRYA